VIVFNVGQTVIDINEPFLELLQMTKKDIIGKMVEELPFFAKICPDLSHLIRDGLKGKETKISAVLVLTDRFLPGTFTMSPVFFENGDPGVALIVSITTNTIHTSLLETGADRSLVEQDEIEYICRFSPDGTITYVNQAFSDLVQKEKADLIGHEWRPTIPESEYKGIKNYLSSLDIAHPVASLEFKIITPNGESRWQRWKFRGIFNQAGQTTGYQGTGLDITEIKKLEEKISRRENEMESLILEHKVEVQDLSKQIYTEISTREKADFQLQFTQFAMNNSSYMIIWISRDARFVYMNKKALTVLGYTYSELTVKNLSDILAVSLPTPWGDIWETLRQDHQYMFETVIKTREGLEIPVEVVLNCFEFKEQQYCCCFFTDITERKQTDKALRESRQILEAVLNSITVRVFWKDKNLVFLGCNTAFARDAGFEKTEDIIGKDDYEMGWHDQAEMFRDDDRAVIASGIPKLLFEEPQITPSGKRIQLLTNKVPLRDANGEIIGVLGTYLDITDRKNAELALQKSEEQYRSLVETTGTGYVILDEEGRVMTANSEYLRLAGRSTLAEIEGRPVTDWTAPYDITRNAQEVEKCFRNGQIRGFEIDYQKPDGTIQPIEINASVIQSGSKQIVQSLCRDITERRKTKEALQLHSQIVQNMAEGVIMIRARDRVIVYANPRFERMFGYDPDELTGKHIDIINSPIDNGPQDFSDKIINSLVRTGVWSGEVHNIMKDGTTFWSHANISTFQHHFHGPVWVSVHEDISKQKRTEEMMREKAAYR
jgi:PAS domain S-box-containing protein